MKSHPPGHPVARQHQHLFGHARSIRCRAVIRVTTLTIRSARSNCKVAKVASGAHRWTAGGSLGCPSLQAASPPTTGQTQDRPSTLVRGVLGTVWDVPDRATRAARIEYKGAGPAQAAIAAGPRGAHCETLWRPWESPEGPHRRGQSLVEFALVLPMLLVLLLGVADFGRVFAAGITVEAAARNAAEAAAQEYLRNPPAPIDQPAPPGSDAYYQALHDLAARTACREAKELDNTTFSADACASMPVIQVCVHDNADPCAISRRSAPSIPTLAANRCSRPRTTPCRVARSRVGTSRSASATGSRRSSTCRTSSCPSVGACRSATSG